MPYFFAYLYKNGVFWFNSRFLGNVLGTKSGLFTFIFNADDLLGNEKYSTAFYSIVYDLSFKLCDDGVVRVQGVDQLGEVHLYDIKVKGGEIWLYNEDGQYIGDELLSPIISPAS